MISRPFRDMYPEIYDKGIYIDGFRKDILKGKIMRRNFLAVLLFAVVSLSLLQLSHNVHAGSFMDKFIDPKDKKLDASD